MNNVSALRDRIGLATAPENLQVMPMPEPAGLQAQFLTTGAKDVLLLGARQTGKSTVAVARAVYEVLHHPESTILLADPTVRQFARSRRRRANL